MCIMLTKPAHERLHKLAIENCFHGNPNGAGFAYATQGQLVIVKRPQWEFEQFWEEALKYEHLPMLLHFRWATHGTLSTENTHPFLLKTVDPNTQFALAHNGIFSVKTKGDKSDTVTVIDGLIQPALLQDKDAFSNPEIIKYLKHLGGWSMLAMLDNHGKFHYFNKSSGVVDLGCWWSNTGYLCDAVESDSRCRPDDNQVDFMDKMQDLADKFDKERFKDGGGMVIMREDDMKCRVCDIEVDPRDGFVISQVSLGVCCSECWANFIGEDINAQTGETTNEDSEPSEETQLEEPGLLPDSQSSDLLPDESAVEVVGDDEVIKPADPVYAVLAKHQPVTA